MNEKEKILKPYKNSIPLKVYGDIDEPFLKEVFLNLIYKDKPDLVVNTDSCLLGIEYFEIDNSFADRKGSRQRKEVAEKRMQLVKEYPKKLSTKKIYDKHSFFNYKVSFYKNFNLHYKKNSEYLSNIQSFFNANKDKKIAYFIDDTTIHGNYVKYGLQLIPIYPFKINQILNFLSKKTEVSYFFFRNLNTDDKTIYVLKNDKQTIKLLKEEFGFLDFSNFFAFDIEISFLK